MKAISNIKKKKELKKKKHSIRSLWAISKCTNIWILGMPGAEEDQEIENLVEKIMKENFSNLVKEIDMQLPEAQSPKQRVLLQDTSQLKCQRLKIKRESQKQQEKRR